MPFRATAPKKLSDKDLRKNQIGFLIPYDLIKEGISLFEFIILALKLLFSAAASLVVPGRLPESTSILLTQALNISGVQPIFDEIDTNTAHIGECSCSEVKTMRTARSRLVGHARM